MFIEEKIDRLEDHLLCTAKSDPASVIEACCDIMDHLSSKGLFMQSQRVEKEYTINRDTEEEELTNISIKPSVYYVSRHIGSLNDMADRLDELRKSANASASGLIVFFIKLLLFIIPLYITWGTPIVQSFLQDRLVYLITSVVLCIALFVLCVSCVSIMEDKWEAIKFALLGIPTYWFFWFCFDRTSMSVGIELVMILASIGHIILFLIRLRLVQGLINNLPFLHSEKRKKDKEEYDYLCRTARDRINRILSKIEIMNEFIGLPKNLESKEEYTKMQRYVWFLNQYYKSLLSRIK